MESRRDSTWILGSPGCRVVIIVCEDDGVEGPLRLHVERWGITVYEAVNEPTHSAEKPIFSCHSVWPVSIP